VKSSRRSTRIAAVEILPSLVRLAVLEPQLEGGIKVQTAAIEWRQAANSLSADDGRLELAAALRQLASQYRLTNVPLHVALSGDFCVTRVVTGLNEVVRRELAELEQRSDLYLSLGHGTKATASCTAPIDARHQRAMLAVANDRVLTSISEALQRAGLQTTSIEPALVSLCRLVGQLNADNERPALIVRGDERGVEVGITYGGQLLLDYRPAARQAKEQAGEIIASHFHRLQRYCDRYVRVDGGKLTSVYVSGEPALIGMVERGLSSAELKVCPLAAQEMDPSWNIAGGANSAEFAAAIGAALASVATVPQQALKVNLLHRRHAHARTAILPALARHCWPIAAALLLSLAGAGYLQLEKVRLAQLEEELEILEPQKSEVRILRMRAVNDKVEADHLQRIANGITSPAWDKLSATISQCMPQDVWLDDVRVDAQGRLQLVGASFTEDGVFEFVRWLEKIPALEHVALSGTRPTRLDTGPATQFDVRCDFTGASGKKEKKDDNG
jgi:hypothetical protein